MWGSFQNPEQCVYTPYTVIYDWKDSGYWTEFPYFCHFSSQFHTVISVIEDNNYGHVRCRPNVKDSLTT